ncbi:hypothetical protein NBRC116188_24330 [Oceaniserpentilla sp. 4NH20-0058]|uniref:hypothetical protein n=1 Tax=Oceaniserpentilla sp. 4NH20-0058 TaxID=3127660 RepID=UPI00310A832C
MKIYILLLMLIGLQGCVAYPKEVWDRADYKRCDLITRELELKVSNMGKPSPGSVRFKSAEELIGFIVASGFVVSTTAVISGSIVIVGNTIHFLEKQGRCDDSILNETIEVFTEPFLETGGELIENTKQDKLVVDKDQRSTD